MPAVTWAASTVAGTRTRIQFCTGNAGLEMSAPVASILHPDCNRQSFSSTRAFSVACVREWTGCACEKVAGSRATRITAMSFGMQLQEEGINTKQREEVAWSAPPRKH